MHRRLKITFLILVISQFLSHTLAQQVPTIVNVEARLGNVLSLNISPDAWCEFGIRQVNDNLYQITKPPRDVMFNVESTGNWSLAISARDAYFTGTNDTSVKVPVEFVGFTIENVGEHWDDGLFSNISNLTKDTVIHLSDERTVLLENGSLNNVGSAEKNSFILRWKFNYEDENLRHTEFSDYMIPDDVYKVGFFLTLSESEPKGRRE